MNHCPNCHGNVFNEITGECAACSHHRHNDFVRALKDETTTGYEHIDRVLSLIRGGKKWRILKKRNKLCWHPGVQTTNGKCVFCMLAAKSDSPVAIGNINEQRLANLNEELTLLTQYKALLETAVALGVDVPQEAPKRGKTRQEAIRDGDKWYTPDSRCKHCWSIGERYVENGRCRSCGK